MRLVRLVYTSVFKHEDFDSSELARIHRAAESNNASQDITGLLAFGEDRFLQCLEGEREAVNRLYAKIVRDPRHRDPQTLRFDEIDERQFSAWTMKLVLLGSDKSALVRAFSPRSRFEPDQMTGEGALRLLMALA